MISHSFYFSYFLFLPSWRTSRDALMIRIHILWVPCAGTFIVAVFILFSFYISVCLGGGRRKITVESTDRDTERQDNLKSDSSMEDSGSLYKHILFSSSYPQASNNYKTLNYVCVLCKDVYKVLSFVIRKYMARNYLNCVDSTTEWKIFSSDRKKW